ncbi:hypothetical protein L917_06955, partial [Phytophthora nicotianae]
WTGATRRPRRAVYAGHTVEAPSVGTPSAPKWPCRTASAGLTAAANVAKSTAASNPHTDELSTCVRNTSSRCVMLPTSKFNSAELIEGRD